MIFNYDKANGGLSFPMFNALSGVKDSIIKVFTKQSFGNEILDSMFGSLDKGTKLNEYMSNMSEE